MVMAVPFLHALRAHHSYGEIWAAGKDSAVHIYNGLNLFDRFVSISNKGFVASLERAHDLYKVGFKQAIALPHSFRSAFFFYNLHIPEIVGYARNKRGIMINRKIPEAALQPEPTMEHYLRIIDVLGGQRTLDGPLLLVADDEEKKFDAAFTDINGPYCVFVIGAEYGPSKCWPQKHFSELADKIIDEYDMKIYMLPGKGEEALAAKVRDGAKNKERIEIKNVNMRDLKVCLSRAFFVVSNDTGPRHMSAALSVPTIVLLGPMDGRYTDYPSPNTYKIEKDLPCRPCNKRTCRENNHACMAGILPDEVFRIIRGIVEKDEKNKRG